MVSPTILHATEMAGNYYKGDEGEKTSFISIPSEIESLANKALFALTFFITILSGLLLGMGLSLNLKIFLIMLAVFILIMMITPEFSDYWFYGVWNYTNFGYTWLKGLTSKILDRKKKDE